MNAHLAPKQPKPGAGITVSILDVQHDRNRQEDREMKTRRFWATLSTVMAAGLVLMSYPYVGAFASVDTSRYEGQWLPPGGWDKLCSPSSINVTPGVNNRSYVARGTCWINVAQDKTDAEQQSWGQAQVTANGFYSLKDHSFRETLTVNTPSGSKSVAFTGTCNDDPWAAKATCSNKNSPAAYLQSTFSWYFGTSQGPLSSFVFSPDLIQSMLSKHESKPPVAPVGLDAVRWPSNGGKSAMGNIKWRAGDMSDNKWVLGFDIEYANYADSTFTKAGRRVGPGPKQNMSAADANLVYLFSTPFALQAGRDYFFRVCAVNDAGRQCSAAVKARQPTQMELASVASNIRPSAGMLGKQPVSPPTAPTGAKGGSGGFGSALTGNRGGATGGGAAGGNAPGGFGSQRPTMVARNAPTAIGGATPGTSGSSAKPDLAVAREGLLVNDRAMAWNATSRLVLHPDASHTCPVHVSFRYTNLGKVAAANVAAEIRDSLQPTQPIATNSVASLAPGQFSNVSGIAKVNAAPTETKVTVTAIVHESGKMLDPNVSNNRGVITLDVLCQASDAGGLAPAGAHAPTSIGAPGAKRPATMR